MRKNLTYKEFLSNLERIKRATSITITETEAEKKKRIEKGLNDYKFFFEYYFSNYAKAECSWFHVFVANLLWQFPKISIVLEWFRGSAKSTHATMGYPLWLKQKGAVKTMLLVGQNENKAERLLADIQAQLTANQKIISDFGLQMRLGSWQDGEFITRDGCAFYAIGIGQSPRGTRNEANRPDYIVVDDVDTRQLSKNQSRINDFVDWIYGDLMGTFDIGAQRFLLVNNRPFKNSVLGTVIKDKFIDAVVTPVKKLLTGSLKGFKIIAPDAFLYQKAGNWHHLKVNAVDKDFNPAWHEKYTKKYWLDLCADIAKRIWSGEYMNNPITEGKIFKEKHIEWIEPIPYKEYDAIVAYCDPSWKNTSTSDYKAIGVWGKKGTELHKLKQFCRQSSTIEMVQWFYDLHESLPSDIICDYYMEASFMQDNIMDDFTTEGENRNYQLPIRGDYRKKPDKYQRIEATQPLYERGFIKYSIKEKNNKDFMEAKEQLLCIEPDYTTPDDAPDADEGAIYILQRMQVRRNTGIRIGKRQAKPY